MPRKGVPYGDAVCSLKERIAELFDLVGKKLHSINGVQGDGQGNVKLKSGDPAVVITGNAAQNEIEIALDNSKLPSAAVSSVNGKTGAVALDAGDIPSDGNSNVQTEIDVGKAGLKNCIVNIIAEREARQNADAALQTNINAARASIPEMSTTPDPYKGIKRNAQGRALAADPASGATDKTLVTANWISQTGDSGPNNLIHKTGDETKNGIMSFANNVYMYNGRWKTSPKIYQKINIDSTEAPIVFKALGGGFMIRDANDRIIWNVSAYRDTDGRDVLEISGNASDGTNGYFHFELSSGKRKITTNFDKPSNW